MMQSSQLEHDGQKPLLTVSTSPPVANGKHADASFSSSSVPPTVHIRPTLPALTGLRAALMLHVLMRNMQLVGAVDTIGWMVKAGAVGVSTFFCLSGFILAYCYGDHRFVTWRCYFAFIGRRYARLLPIYWLSQLMCVGAQVNAVRQYGWDGWTVLHWLAIATGTNTWWPWPEYERSVEPQWRGVFMLNETLWALSVVLFFYVTMPLLLRAIRRVSGVDRLSELPRGASTPRLLFLFVFFSALVWASIAATSLHGDSLAVFTPYFRVPEFALGVVAAALYISVRQRQQQQQQRQEQTSDTSGTARAKDTALIDWLASTPLLHSPLVLDLVTASTVVAYILLALPSIHTPLFVTRPAFLDTGNWAASVLCYIVLALALTSPSKDAKTGQTSRNSVLGWLLTRPLALELGAMSFCFYAFHYVPLVYAESIGLPPNRSAAVEFCAAVGLAWLGYKYVETPVYAALSARLPVCRCHRQ